MIRLFSLITGWMTVAAMSAILFVMSCGWENPVIMNILVQVMHGFFVLSSVGFLVTGFRVKNILQVLAVSVPVLAFLVSFILLFAGFRFSKPFLAGFDIYVLVIWTAILSGIRKKVA